MAADAPWFRQNADWPFTRWLDRLGYPLAGIWSYLLAYVKANGNGRGQCKSIDPELFGRIYRIPTEDVVLFFDAAKAAGAFEDDGKRWTITAWAEYQSPQAEAMRRARSQEPNVNHKPEKLITSGDCENAVTRQDSTAQDNRENPPLAPLTADPEATEPPLEVVEGELVDDEPVRESEVPIYPVNPDDPWWDGEDVDPLVRDAVLACRDVPKFKNFDYRRERFEKLVADNRARAPDDAAIRYEFEGFTEWHQRNKPKYVEAATALKVWLGNKHDRWAAMRKNQPRGEMDRFKKMMGG